MTRPIVAGIIAEVLAVLSLEDVTAKSVDMIQKIADVDSDVTDDMIVFGLTTVGDIRSEPDFWDNILLVNNVVAAYLESVTMRVANPLLSAIPGITQADVRAVIEATDELQIAAVPVVVERVQELFAKPVVQRFADIATGGAWEHKFVF